MDQPKIERMLRLMKMMSDNINYSVDELSQKLEMSDRTIYRYIDTFKNAGFTVRKIWANTYKLEKIPKAMPDKVADREIFMKGVDYSCYYEQV